MSDCLFCSIVAGTIPADVVYTDDQVLGFRDIHPQAPLHVLVIPRAHFPTLAEVAVADPALVGAMVTAAQAIVDGAGSPAGYRLVVNTGAGAGQTVLHAHLHILAGRRFDEGLA